MGTMQNNGSFRAFAALPMTNPFADLHSRPEQVSFRLSHTSAAGDVTDGKAVFSGSFALPVPTVVEIAEAISGTAMSRVTDPGAALFQASRSVASGIPATV